MLNFLREVWWKCFLLCGDFIASRPPYHRLVIISPDHRKFMTGVISLSQEAIAKLSWSMFVRHFCRVFLFLSVWLLAACGAGDEIDIPITATLSPSYTPTEIAATAAVPAATPTAEPTETAVSATNTPVPPTPTPSATPKPVPTITHYSLWATLNMSQRQLLVTQTITYVNNTGVTHIDLPLLVEPARFNDAFHLHTFVDSEEAALTFGWEMGT
jgi:hypothetical protein